MIRFNKKRKKNVVLFSLLKLRATTGGSIADVYVHFGVFEFLLHTGFRMASEQPSFPIFLKAPVIRGPGRGFSRRANLPSGRKYFSQPIFRNHFLPIALCSEYFSYTTRIRRQNVDKWICILWICFCGRWPC